MDSTQIKLTYGEIYFIKYIYNNTLVGNSDIIPVVQIEDLLNLTTQWEAEEISQAYWLSTSQSYNLSLNAVRWLGQKSDQLLGNSSTPARYARYAAMLRQKCGDIIINGNGAAAPVPEVAEEVSDE